MTAPGRRPAAVPVLIPLLVLVPLLTAITACGPQPVSPLPTLAAGRPGVVPAGTPAVAQAPSATRSPPRSVTATTTVPAANNPPPPPVTTTTTSTPTLGPSTSESTSSPPCWGIVQYDLDLQETELALITSMCLRAGSILRLQGIGPGLVTAEPTSVASQSYAGGVVDIRFIRPGTATVTIPQNDEVHTIPVVVIS